LPAPLFLPKFFILKPKFMKTLYTLLLGVVAVLTFNTANAFTSLVVAPSTSLIIKEPGPNALSMMSARQFLELTPQKYKEMTGKKMNLVQKVELRVLQHKVKKMVKKGEVVSMADVQKKFYEMGSMDLLGFLLGLILGPIGVIICLILKETGDVGPDTLRWSLYGLLVWLAIVFLIILF
jgi:hypothetical protein